MITYSKLQCQIDPLKRSLDIIINLTINQMALQLL